MEYILYDKIFFSFLINRADYIKNNFKLYYLAEHTISFKNKIPPNELISLLYEGGCFDILQNNAIPKFRSTICLMISLALMIGYKEIVLCGIDMKTHEQIDRRSLLITRAIVAKIDDDPSRAGLAKARALCRQWSLQRSGSAVQEWSDILQQSWESIRQVLIDDSDESRRLRQSSPFCGILTPQERWQLYKAFDAHETRRS